MGPEAETLHLFRVAVLVEKNRKEYKSNNLAYLSLYFLMEKSPFFLIIHNYPKRNISIHNENKEDPVTTRNM